MNQKITSSPSPKPFDDPLIRVLATSIRYAVRILAVLMVLVACTAPMGNRSRGSQRRGPGDSEFRV